MNSNALKITGERGEGTAQWSWGTLGDPGMGQELPLLAHHK